MSNALYMRDGRVIPWFQVGKAHTAALATYFSGRRLPIARSLYFGILELVNDARGQDRVKARRKDITRVSGVSPRVVTEYIDDLEKAGVLRVVRGDEGQPHEWILTDPPGVEAASPTPSGSSHPPSGSSHPPSGSRKGGLAAAATPIETVQEEQKCSSSTERARGDLASVPGEMTDDVLKLLESKTKVDGALVTEREMAIAGAALWEFNQQAGTQYGLGAQVRAIVMRIRERPSWSLEQHVRLVASAFRVRWWEKSGRESGRRVSPAVIWGNERCFENVVQDMLGESAGGGRERKFVRRPRNDSAA